MLVLPTVGCIPADAFEILFDKASLFEGVSYARYIICTWYECCVFIGLARVEEGLLGGSGF